MGEQLARLGELISQLSRYLAPFVDVKDELCHCFIFVLTFTNRLLALGFRIVVIKIYVVVFALFLSFI